MTRLAIVMLTMILCVMPGCKKEVVGPKGDPGPAGSPGANGKDAEVVGTGNIIVQSSQWITPDSVQWYATIHTAVISSAVVDGGTVQVFIRNGDRWQTLPYLDHTLYITFEYEAGKLYLRQADSHGGLPPKPGTQTYKVVGIYDEDWQQPRLFPANRLLALFCHLLEATLKVGYLHRLLHV